MRGKRYTVLKSVAISPSESTMCGRRIVIPLCTQGGRVTGKDTKSTRDKGLQRRRGWDLYTILPYGTEDRQLTSILIRTGYLMLFTNYNKDRVS